MAQKRKIAEAFGGRPNPEIKNDETLFSSASIPAPQVSAFAAARRPTQPSNTGENDLISTISSVSYDGHHSSRASPGLSSADEDEGLYGAAPKPARQNMQLSSVTLSKKNVLSDTEQHLEIRLQANESATFVGEYDLEVVKGIVNIYGAVLQSNTGPQRVYAPSVSALPAIVSRRDETVVILSSVKGTVSSLETLSPIFRNIGGNDDIKGRSFTFLSSTADDALRRSLFPLDVDDEVKKVISRLHARLDSSDGLHLHIMAVGPKSSGKSTLNKILCNSITNRVGKCLYLDLDPGQPEFAPPGQLCLIEVTAPILGPSFTHPASTFSKAARLLRSHTIAATTFKDDAEHYHSCAMDLLDHAPKDIPIVVNGCGWVSGLGASVVEALTRKLTVSDVVLFEPVDSELVQILSESVSGRIHRIPRRVRQPGTRSPAELRAMQTMAYFHHKPNFVKLTWTSKPISKLRPFTVSYAGGDDGIAAILSYGQSPHPDFLGEVLDGSVVAIVVCDYALIDLGTIEYTNEGFPFLPENSTGHTPPLDPRNSRCLALALIRGIDVEQKTLQLVTPLPEGSLQEMTLNKQVVLVRGGFDTPEWAYLEDVHSVQSDGGTIDRPWVTSDNQGGIEGSVWRLRHPPMAKDVR